MSILDQLCTNGTFRRWGAEREIVPQRYFWYTSDWMKGFNALSSSPRGRRLERDTSEKGRVAGLINEYVLGTPQVRLVTPNGYGSEPVTKRLDPPRQMIVYFRTGAIQSSAGVRLSPGVRCFGIFRSPNIFYALAIMRKQVRRGGVDPIDAAINRYEEFIKYVTNEVDAVTHVEKLITP